MKNIDVDINSSNAIEIKYPGFKIRDVNKF